MAQQNLLQLFYFYLGLPNLKAVNQKDFNSRELTIES
jgi:hypothetical protein